VLQSLSLVLMFLAAGAAADPAVDQPVSAVQESAMQGSVMIDARQWALTSSGENLRWGDADAYCRALTLDGHADWRLPSLDELATLQDPTAVSGIREPIRIETCCLWSSTSLEDLPADASDPPGASASRYFWGIVFDGGIHYYSNRGFADGQALCTRDQG